MLTQLNLKNYVIIESLQLRFGKGLNVITGETGTGKSIIVDALNIILGDRAGNDIVRSGSEQAVIEAVFDITGRDDITEHLYSRDIEVTGGELLVRRVIPREGRGRVYLNDNLVTLKYLSEVMDKLIDIFSQHEHQSLLRERKHIQYLDLFMNRDDLKDKYNKVFRDYKTALERLGKLQSSVNEKLERQDFLKYQLKELRSLNPKPGEDAELEQEEKILSNSEKIAEAINEANRVLYESDNSVFVQLNRIQKRINSISDIDQSLGEIANSLSEIIISLEDVTRITGSYSDSIKHDPARLDEISARLAELNRMKKKYNCDIEGLIEKSRQIGEELEMVENIDEEIRSAENQCNELRTRVLEIAGTLGEERRKSASQISSLFSQEAEYVGLKDAVFEVEFEEKEPGPEGCERARFLLSANPGEPPRELSRVASGGELSRVMLLLKELLSGDSHGSVLIFDEADSGIGGAVAEAIGRKIKSLSENNQVLCITHLPQVAKFADLHYLVSKRTDGGKTYVSVRSLDREDRIQEIGRMLAGETITNKTLEAAREMLADI